METHHLDKLYQKAILEHLRHPRNRDDLIAPDLYGHAVNPFCGDEVYVQIILDKGRVSEVGVRAEGCSINQATASMVSETINGLTLDQVASREKLFRNLMQGAPTNDRQRVLLGELSSLESVREYPVRIKCALLTWTAVEDAIKSHEPQ